MQSQTEAEWLRQRKVQIGLQLGWANRHLEWELVSRQEGHRLREPQPFHQRIKYFSSLAIISMEAAIISCSQIAKATYCHLVKGSNKASCLKQIRQNQVLVSHISYLLWPINQVRASQHHCHASTDPGWSTGKKKQACLILITRIISLGSRLEAWCQQVLTKL